MGRLAGAAKAKGNTQLVIFLENVNTYLTDIFNDFLNNKMGLPASITDFVEDFGDTIKYLEEKGPVYSSGFFRFEADLLKQIFSAPDKDIAEGLTEQMLGESSDKVKLTFLVEGVSVTLAPLVLSEFSIVLDDDQPKLLTETVTPELWRLAVSAFEQKEAFITTREHYLVTRDNRVFKFHKGYVGLESEERYLISQA
jgi:hypothetical protein